MKKHTVKSILSLLTILAVFTCQRSQDNTYLSQALLRDKILHLMEKPNLSEVAELYYSPRGTTICIDARFTVDSGRAGLNPRLLPFLDSLVTIINDPMNKFPIAVEGHTDNLPIPEVWVEKYPSNWELSGARATIVFRYLLNKGVPGGKLRAVGFADRIPCGTSWMQTMLGVTEEMVRAGNSTEELRSMNRRIEITFLSVG